MLNVQGQNNLKLVIGIDPSTPPGYKQQIFLRGYLKNISTHEIKITKPTPYAMWHTDNDKWILIKNATIQPAFKFVEPPDRKFRKSDLIDLKPNDSVFVSVYHWDTDVEGKYEVKLQYEQIKNNIDKFYVNEKLLQDREDFKLESNTISFEIVKPVPVAIKQLLPYDKLMGSKVFSDSYTSEIFLNPNDVYRLSMSKGSNYTLFKDCKNIQWLKVEGMDMDSIPEFFCNLNLQYLDFGKSTSKPVFDFVPASFCSGGNLRHLQFSYGLPGKMPEWLFLQKKLEYLRIFATLINNLDSRIGDFTQLKTLDLTNIENQEAIPSSFANLTMLEELTLDGKNIKDISVIENLPHLKMVKIFSPFINNTNEVLKRMKLKNKDLLIFTKFGMVI
jgi:Leucine-rich repeat (LRR) protein